MLEMVSVKGGYGPVNILRGFTLSVKAGEVMCLLGRNGAGKTTALKAIMGLVRPEGLIALDGERIDTLAPHLIPRHGVGYVPQGRRLFSELTVRENLEIGLMARGTGLPALERVLTLFPLLKERLTQRSGTMSGGEQQMLAMARALCLEPKLLLLDEPTEGLMPSMIERIRASVMELKRQGVTTLLVEQRVDAVLAVADRVAFVENGAVIEIVEAERLRHDPALIERYVGVGH